VADAIISRRQGEGLEKLAQTLFLSRPLLNAPALIAWAKSQGFKTTLAPEDMHLTQSYSKTAFEWDQVGIVPNPFTSTAGSRAVCPLGDGGAVVLKFEEPVFAARWASVQAGGASSDYPTFTPHVTISWDASDLDLSKVIPYTGPLEFGPEVFRELNPDWKAGIIEKGPSARVLKVDATHGLVFGFAIVCKVDGEDYYDLNIDDDGEIVPEHIPEDAMFKCAADFMAEAERPGNDMHMGPKVGKFIFAFPMTTDIAKALGMTTPKTGLLVGFKPPPDILAKYANGTYTGFSIEGTRGECEEIG
jgi:hypothetical protein